MNTDNTDTHNKDRHILIAADNSENAKRAVLYVGDLLGGFPGFRVTILTVIPEPPADYFGTEGELASWIEKQKADAATLLENYRRILIQSGFGEDKVDTMLDVRYCPSVGECILDTQQKVGCCTVVVGRRGISRKEEFLFGSTSSKIMHSVRNCAVWVVG